MQDFIVCPRTLRSRVDTFLVEADSVTVAIRDVPFQTIVCHVCLSIGEPSVQELVGSVHNFLRLLEPVNLLGLLGPKLVPVFD